MPRRKKPAWTWADYERQHGPRPTAETVNVEPLPLAEQYPAVIDDILSRSGIKTPTTFDQERAAEITSQMMGDPPPGRAALDK